MTLMSYLHVVVVGLCVGSLGILQSVKGLHQNHVLPQVGSTDPSLESRERERDNDEGGEGRTKEESFNEYVMGGDENGKYCT